MDDVLGFFGPKTKEEAVIKIDELETKALKFMELADKNGCYAVWHSGPMKAARYYEDQADQLRYKFKLS